MWLPRLFLMLALPCFLAACARPSVVMEGTLTYAGKPMAAYAKMQPVFRFRDHATNEAVTGISTWYDPATSRYRLENLPETPLRISVVFHVAGVAASLPGNFNIRRVVEPAILAPESLRQYNLPLETVMRLLTPVNLSNPLPAEDAQYASLTAPVAVHWQAIPDASFYEVTLQQCRDSAYPAPFQQYGQCSTVGYIQTENPFVSLPLAPSSDLRHFRLSISASDGAGNQLASLMTTYDNGDHERYFPFKVQSQESRQNGSAEDDGSAGKDDAP